MNPSAEEDAFGVQLRWPADPLDQQRVAPAAEESTQDDQVGEPERRPPIPERTPEEPVSRPAPEPPRSRPEIPSMAASIAGLAELQDRPGLETALAGVAARVDALAAATVTFRNIVSDRVSEVFMRTAELVSEQATDTAATRRDVARCLDAVAAVTERASNIEAELAAHRSEVMRALEAIADEVHGLRRRTPVRAAKAAKLDEDELQALADAVAASLRRDPGRPATRPRRTRST